MVPGEPTRLQLDAEMINACEWEYGIAIIPLGPLGQLDVEEVIKNKRGHYVVGNLLPSTGEVNRASLNLFRRGLLGKLLNRAVEATIYPYPQPIAQNSIQY